MPVIYNDNYQYTLDYRLMLKGKFILINYYFKIYVLFKKMTYPVRRISRQIIHISQEIICLGIMLIFHVKIFVSHLL